MFDAEKVYSLTQTLTVSLISHLFHQFWMNKRTTDKSSIPVQSAHLIT